jgi:hypothetical protein
VLWRACWTKRGSLWVVASTTVVDDVDPDYGQSGGEVVGGDVMCGSFWNVVAEGIQGDGQGAVAKTRPFTDCPALVFL